MSFYIDATGRKHDVPATLELYAEARDAGMTLAQLINTKFAVAGAEPDLKLGNVFQQVCASEGLVVVGAKNPFGQRSPYLQDIFDGKSGYNVAVEPTSRANPYGTQARTLFPMAVLEMIEDSIQPDRTTDDALFRSMVKMNQSINTDSYMQPVISYAGANRANGGTNAAGAQRITELSNTPMMLMLNTSEKFRTLPTYGIGIEVSEKAMKATTLDMMVMTVNRYTQIEKDARVYQYISEIFLGDLDHNTGAVGAVTSTSLDAAATGGVLTHKAWVKFLALKRKTRKITHLILDIDTYLKVESRTGRPGSNNYDPTLERVDPQARAMNKNANGFANDVVYMIVDSAAEGGPVPAGEIWALDKENAIMVVRNTSADFKATEDFVLRRSSAMVWHWGEVALRLWGDSELTPFARLQIL